MVATDPSREIHNRPEEELDVFDSQSHDIEVSLAGRACMLRERQGRILKDSGQSPPTLPTRNSGQEWEELGGSSIP